MNKKGFMFVETIMVITILTTSLIMIYVSFSRVLINEKRRVAFDDTAYIYRTYFIEDYLVSLNLYDYINKYLNNTSKRIIVLNTTDTSLYNLYENGTENKEEANRQLFSSLLFNTLNTLNVNKIYITYYNVNDLKSCTTKSGKTTNASSRCSKETIDALNNMSTNAILYLKTLAGTDDGYRLIVEYQENTVDYTRSQTPNGSTCQTGYTLDRSTSKCYKNVTKYYYNSVKLFIRGA